MSNSTRAISRSAPARGLYAALALTVALLCGCAVQHPSNLAPPAPDANASGLAARERILGSIQTPAIIEYSGPAGRMKAREQLTARRPADLRVEAASPLGVALVVTADNDQIAVFNPSNNTLIRGAANAATLERFTGIPIEPRQAVRLLLGLVPDNSILALAPSAVRTEGAMKVLAYAISNQMSYELGFSDGHLALVREMSAPGQLVYEVRYSDYEDIGAIEFPCVIEAHFFNRATTIKFRYLDPAIDRNFPDSVFVLSPGPGTKLINLNAASASPASSVEG
jgi:hypothetical protein